MLSELNMANILPQNMILTNISYSVNKYNILNAFSMDISERGKLYLLSGSNGSGKSTVLKIMSGVIRNFKGYVGNNTYENIYYCHDSLGMFPNFTGLENVRHFNKEVDCILLEYLLDIFDMTLNIKKKYSEMSLGMKMKTALITTFVAKPDLVVLDEPLNGLDKISQDTFLAFIKNELLANNRSVLICSHFSNEFESLPVFKRIRL